MTSSNKKIAVAIYVRSGKDKIERISIEKQIEAIKKYCKDWGDFIPSESFTYTDSGRSGSRPVCGRPGFKKLIEDAKLKKFRIVICHLSDHTNINYYGKLFDAISLGVVYVR